jgi:hypothetical protein
MFPEKREAANVMCPDAQAQTYVAGDRQVWIETFGGGPFLAGKDLAWRGLFVRRRAFESLRASRFDLPSIVLGCCPGLAGSIVWISVLSLHVLARYTDPQC